MISVEVSPMGAHAEALMAGGAVGRYAFVAHATHVEHRLILVERELPAPYVVREAAHAPEVLLTTHRAEEFARYTGRSVGQHLRLGAIAGLTRARSLKLNPDLQLADLQAHCHPHCVMCSRLYLEEWLPVFEYPMLCRGCEVFYAQLITPQDLEALKSVVKMSVSLDTYRGG